MGAIGSAAEPLTNAQLRAAPVSVSGTITADLSGSIDVSNFPASFSISNFPGSFAISGGVSVSNFPASQAVTGTFFQATQPVSIAATVAISAAALPLPSGAASETTLAALNTKHPAQGQAVMAASVPVAIASNQSSLPVTGTFWQSTQPVSGSVSVSNFPASQAVTGTFFQTTQPVSLAALPALAAGANSIGTTPGPALVKGTQGTVGHSTQDLKDAGRVIVNVASAIAGVTAVTTEALLSMNISRDCAATSAATSMAVTSGKRWRVTAIVVGIVSTSAAVLSARFSLRMNPTGAVTATSPIIATIPLSSGAALAQAGNQLMVAFPDGIEFSGTMQIGISHVASAVTGVVRASLIGYEY